MGRRVNGWLKYVLALVAVGCVAAVVFALPGSQAVPAGAGSGAKDAISYRVLDKEVPPEVSDFREATKEHPGLYPLTVGDATYLLVSWGQKRTGGYAVSVRGARQDGDVIVIEVALTAPKPGDIVTQVITHPHALIALPATEASFAAEFSGAEWAPKGTEGLPLVSGDVFVNSPPPMSAATSPISVVGAIRASWEKVRVSIEDGHDVLGSAVVEVKAVGEAWRPFRTKLQFRKPTNPVGHLIVSAWDPATGAWVEKVGVPLRFQSGS